MLDQSDTAPIPSIWDFACTLYGGDGVKDDCLVAQDAFGLPVTSLIFALYCVKYGRAVDLNAARTLGADLSAKRVVPLRNARRALPADTQQRREMLEAELEAERMVLEALAALPFSDSKEDWERAARAAHLRQRPGAARAARSCDSALSNDPTSYQSALLSIAGLEQGACPSNLGDVLKRLALAAQKM